MGRLNLHRLVTPTAGVLHVLVAIAYGVVGNAVYGFETIHMSLGDTHLVDQPAAVNLIKPLGLLTLGTILVWPIAHIGNLPFLAVPVNVGLVVAIGSLVWARAPERYTRY